MLRCSATRAMTRTLHEPWPRPKRPPSAGDPPSQSAAPPENRRVNQPETVSVGACAGRRPGDHVLRVWLDGPPEGGRSRGTSDLRLESLGNILARPSSRRAHLVHGRYGLEQGRYKHPVRTMVVRRLHRFL